MDISKIMYKTHNQKYFSNSYIVRKVLIKILQINFFNKVTFSFKNNYGKINVDLNHN